MGILEVLDLVGLGEERGGIRERALQFLNTLEVLKAKPKLFRQTSTHPDRRTCKILQMFSERRRRASFLQICFFPHKLLVPNMSFVAWSSTGALRMTGRVDSPTFIFDTGEGLPSIWAFMGCIFGMKSRIERRENVSSSRRS